MTRTKGTRSKGRRQNGRSSENGTGVARIMQNITRKRMKMRTETKRNYAKKPNRISISEVSEKNALITDRRNARIETENNQKNNNKRGCNRKVLLPTMAMWSNLTSYANAKRKEEKAN